MLLKRPDIRHGMPDFMRKQTGSPKTERVEFAAQNEKYEFSQRGVH